MMTDRAVLDRIAALERKVEVLIRAVNATNHLLQVHRHFMDEAPIEGVEAPIEGVEATSQARYHENDVDETIVTGVEVKQ